MVKYYVDFIRLYGPGREPQAKHYAAIGHFVSSFVRIEIALHHLLRHILKLDDALVRAIYGEARAVDVMNHITRLSQLKGDADEVKVAIDNTFTKIRALKTMRDHAAHRAFDAHLDELTFHNRDTARAAPGDAVIYTVQQLHSFANEAAELANDVSAIMPLRDIPAEQRPQPSLRTRLQQAPKDKGRRSAKRDR